MKNIFSGNTIEINLKFYDIFFSPEKGLAVLNSVVEMKKDIKEAGEAARSGKGQFEQKPEALEKEVSRGKGYAFTKKLSDTVDSGKQISLDDLERELRIKYGISDIAKRMFILRLLIQNEIGLIFGVGPVTLDLVETIFKGSIRGKQSEYKLSSKLKDKDLIFSLEIPCYKDEKAVGTITGGYSVNIDNCSVQFLPIDLKIDRTKAKEQGLDISDLKLHYDNFVAKKGKSVTSLEQEWKTYSPKYWAIHLAHLAKTGTLEDLQSWLENKFQANISKQISAINGLAGANELATLEIKYQQSWEREAIALYKENLYKTIKSKVTKVMSANEIIPIINVEKWKFKDSQMAKEIVDECFENIMKNKFFYCKAATWTRSSGDFQDINKFYINGEAYIKVYDLQDKDRIIEIINNTILIFLSEDSFFNKSNSIVLDAFWKMEDSSQNKNKGLSSSEKKAIEQSILSKKLFNEYVEEYKQEDVMKLEAYLSSCEEHSSPKKIATLTQEFFHEITGKTLLQIVFDNITPEKFSYIIKNDLKQHFQSSKVLMKKIIAAGNVQFLKLMLEKYIQLESYCGEGLEIVTLIDMYRKENNASVTQAMQSLLLQKC